MNKKMQFLVMAALFTGSAMTSCTDDDDNSGGSSSTTIESDFIGKAVGNFTAQKIHLNNCRRFLDFTPLRYISLEMTAKA